MNGGRRKLTEEEIEESIRFGNGAAASAGRVVNTPDPETEADLRAALRGEMAVDEVTGRLAARIKGRPPEILEHKKSRDG